MQEFICPNGRMSVNGVCPIFEGDDGQIKDYQKPKTFDQKYNEIEDIEKQRDKSSFFKFDFEKPTKAAFEKADNIISNNINYYNNFVEDKLGIPSSVQNVFRIGSALTASSPIGAIAPFAIPFMLGGALKASDNRRIQNITMNDPQGNITTIDPIAVAKRMQIMSIQPTARDTYMGGGPGRDTTPSRPTAQAGGFASDGGPVSNRTGKGRVGF